MTEAMQALPVEELQPITDRMKFEHGELLVKVEVDVRPAYHALPCGIVAGHGKSIAKVRKRDVPALMALVETEPHEIEAAQRRYDNALNDYIKKGLEGIEPANSEKRREQLIADYPGSMEAIFFRDMNRSIKPLVSVRVVEDNIPVPVDEAQTEQQSALVKALSAEFAKAFAGVLGQQTQQKKS
jgi:hypothetical protein